MILMIRCSDYFIYGFSCLKQVLCPCAFYRQIPDCEMATDDIHFACMKRVATEMYSSSMYNYCIYFDYREVERVIIRAIDRRGKGKLRWWRTPSLPGKWRKSLELLRNKGVITTKSLWNFNTGNWVILNIKLKLYTLISKPTYIT